MRRIFLVIFIIASCNIGTRENKNIEKVVQPTTIESDSTKLVKPKMIEKAPSEKEKKFFDNAYNLWYNDRTLDAIKKFNDFIKLYPKSSLADDAQRMLGTAYGNLENYDQAITEYKKVRINYPNSNSTPLSIYDIAHIYYYSLNDFTKARYYYNEFINSASEENIKFRDIAVNQLKNLEEKAKILKRKSQIETSVIHTEMKNQSWYKGGNLHKANKNEWIKATEHNKLATCADFTMIIAKRNGKTPSVFSNEFKIASESLKECIEKFYKFSGSGNTSVSQVAIICISN